MLIAGAEVYGLHPADVRIEQGRISEIGRLQRRPSERVIEAGGGALLPGLHDHHLHLRSFAAALESVRCGPPEVTNADTLAAALHRARTADGRWIRGIGYHESVAGDIDRRWLDRHGPDAPVRIQHRSGRLWIVNSAGVERLAEAADRLHVPLPGPGLADGRLYDLDSWLRQLTVSPPALGPASRRLARWGVTGVTDMTPDNGAEMLATLSAAHVAGTLLQRVRVAGRLDLSWPDGAVETAWIRIGETKVHLHETALPPLDDLCRTIAASHDLGRPVAVHCVTEAELVFALAAFGEASTRRGDRIEHASVTPPALLDRLRELNLTVVTQPNFVAERGDAYLADVPPAEHAWLYRCRSFLAARIPLAGGTDAPFGHADPWRAMHAAVQRTTASGRVLGPQESLSPEQALALFLGPLESPAEPRRIEVSAAADLCLLDRPWARARKDLSSDAVRATLCNGSLIYDGVDEAPV